MMLTPYLEGGPSHLPSYLHTQAGLGSCEGQNLDLDPLAFADHVGHVSHAALPAELGDVDQPLPPFPAEQRLIRRTGGREERWWNRSAHEPEPLQLDEAAELHDAGDLPTVDVPHRGLLGGGPLHVLVLPPLRVPLLPGARGALAPPGRLLSLFPSISISAPLPVSGAGTRPASPLPVLLPVPVSVPVPVPVSVSVSLSASAATPTGTSALLSPAGNVRTADELRCCSPLATPSFNKPAPTLAQR